MLPRSRTPSNLACGLPIVRQRRGGDYPEFIRRLQVGVVVTGASDAGYREAVLELRALLTHGLRSPAVANAAVEELDLMGVLVPRSRRLCEGLPGSPGRMAA